jgi:hypothetical protein
MCADLTDAIRQNESSLAHAVRHALSERHIDVGTSAIADFCPTSASLADGERNERHHLVVVNCEGQAFVGRMHRNAETARFDQWREVPAAPIANRDSIIRRINENRRARRAWNDGVEPSITDPADVIYNSLIEVAVELLESETGDR